LAQSNVYSLNVVGYYNITIAANQKIIIANQLNTTNNTVGALLVPPMVHDSDKLFKWSGSAFLPNTYSDLDGAWSTPAMTLNVGEAAFYQPSAATTLTFVGEVLQGTLINTLPLGQKVLRSSMVPQAGIIDTQLGVVPDDSDKMFTFNPLQNGTPYIPYSYSSLDGAWTPPNPTVQVGQGFFYAKAANGAPANANWVRNFTVQ